MSEHFAGGTNNPNNQKNKEQVNFFEHVRYTLYQLAMSYIKYRYLSFKEIIFNFLSDI